jgi:hypothetical protein
MIEQKQTFRAGDRVVVIHSRKRGTVEGWAGDWLRDNERDWYSVWVDGWHYVLHADQMRLESKCDDDG